MDFRGSSDNASTRLAVHSTKLTPQLENYDLYHGYRELPTSYEGSQPFMLAFNLASVMEDELKIKIINKNEGQDKVILQVEVAHMGKEAEGVHPFARNCCYRIELPEDLHDKDLTALWTEDHHLIVVESSNFIEVLTQAEETKEAAEVDTQVEEAVSVITPRKVKCVFKPIAEVDVIKKAVTVSELGLYNVKRIIENGSFSYPDIGRPVEEQFNTYLVEKKSEIVPFEGYFMKNYVQVIKEKMAEFESKEKVDKEMTDVASEEKVEKEMTDITSEEKVDKEMTDIALEEKVDKEMTDIALVEKVNKEMTDIALVKNVIKEMIDTASEENVDKEKAGVADIAQEKVKKEKADIAQEKVDKEKADVTPEEKVDKEKADVTPEEKVEKEKADLTPEEKVEKEKADLTPEEKVEKEKADITPEEKVEKEEVDITSEEKVDEEMTDISSDENVDR